MFDVIKMDQLSYVYTRRKLHTTCLFAIKTKVMEMIVRSSFSFSFLLYEYLFNNYFFWINI